MLSGFIPLALVAMAEEGTSLSVEVEESEVVASLEEAS